MSKETVGKVVSIVLVAVVALLAVFGYDVGVIQPRETVAVGEVLGSRAVGDTSFTNLVATGDMTMGGALRLGVASITPTAGETITPVYSLYVINSSGAVSITLAAPSAAGQVLYLYGDDAYTVTINDTNIRSTDGNAVTLGQYDVVEWISTDTEWIHVAKSADS